MSFSGDYSQLISSEDAKAAVMDNLQSALVALLGCPSQDLIVLDIQPGSIVAKIALASPSFVALLNSSLGQGPLALRDNTTLNYVPDSLAVLGAATTTQATTTAAQAASASGVHLGIAAGIPLAIGVVVLCAGIMVVVARRRRLQSPTPEADSFSKSTHPTTPIEITSSLVDDISSFPPGATTSLRRSTTGARENYVVIQFQ